MNLTYDCNLVLDGIWGTMCKRAALEYCLSYRSPIITNLHVLFIQQLLNNIGYSLKTDSMFGPDCRQKTMNFQHDYNLVVDGYIGPDTTKKLLFLNKYD